MLLLFDVHTLSSCPKASTAHERRCLNMVKEKMEEIEKMEEKMLLLTKEKNKQEEDLRKQLQELRKQLQEKEYHNITLQQKVDELSRELGGIQNLAHKDDFPSEVSEIAPSNSGELERLDQLKKPREILQYLSKDEIFIKKFEMLSQAQYELENNLDKSNLEDSSLTASKASSEDISSVILNSVNNTGGTAEAQQKFNELQFQFWKKLFVFSAEKKSSYGELLKAMAGVAVLGSDGK